MSSKTQHNTEHCHVLTLYNYIHVLIIDLVEWVPKLLHNK